MLNRIDKLREILLSGSAALILSDVNRLYYSDFKSSAGALLITEHSAILFLDFRYYEAAVRSVDRSINVVRYSNLTESINAIINKESIKNIIIEDEFVTIARFDNLKNEINAEFTTDFKLSSKIMDFRMIKSDDEIERIKTAQKISEKSYKELLNYIKVGVSEKRLALELEHQLKINGAERLAFDIISISGKNTSLPHGVPSEKELCDGDFITFDFGAVYDGYHSDMTRTIALGYASDEMKEVYDIVLNAHKIASKAIKPSKWCSDVDKAAREYIRSFGYGEYFGHSTGHGVGLEIHEKPTVYHTNNQILKPGMVITNEPGIYLPDKFGVRIEDMYLVTENGFEDLAFIDKELLII
ncbi:MAG: aminopeptidase P family protein [Ruminococcus sp.]|nr:aminopeptidase P family protein [Ruminococcus sp.]